MSFSRAKIGRTTVRDAASKESTTSTNSKLTPKLKNDKWAQPKSTRIPPKVTKPVGQRSVSQPSSTTALNSKSPRPRSVDNTHMSTANSSKGDLDKMDDDSNFYSTTVLHMPELSKIDEDSKSAAISEARSFISESKSNISGIPLRIKNSQVISKDAKVPRNNKIVPKVKTPSRDSPHSTFRGTTSNSLMAQFETKKRRLLVMKEELTTKQHLIVDSYKALADMKKKLDQSGMGHLVLEDLDVVPNAPIDPTLMENMKLTLNEIPRPLVNLCRELMHKRQSLVEILDHFVQKKIPNDEVEKSLKLYKEETNTLEREMVKNCEGQQGLIKRLMYKWSLLSNNSGDASSIIQQVEDLQDKLKEQESRLETVNRNLQAAIEQNGVYEKRTYQAEATVAQLKDKIKVLEHDLSAEKSTSQIHKEKFSTNEQKLKAMKQRVQELEVKCRESENKCNELHKSCKHTQDQIRTNEHRWLKEKEELQTKSKHDKQMLDKLTKDRSSFETRAKTCEGKLKEELEETKKLLAEEKLKKESLQQRFEQVQNQLAEIEIRHKQALDVVNTKNTYEPREAENISTEREVELYTELLATRVGLKAAEEKLQSYHREKMRFLDTIQLLQGENNDSVATLENLQKLTEMEARLSDNDEIIYRQKMEISNLNSEIEQLKLKEKSSSLNGASRNEEESDLKLMLREGKTKIEQLIKKSSENEQKAIIYKHDLDKRSKQLCEMENLLKAREELLTMMKIKKDELQVENNSLNQYANEIRELLIQSREEARNRNELVQELTMNLDTKGRACEQLEKMIKELEYSLSVTNEKRFKLQESIGVMEKELQSTKAHIINTKPEVKIHRYGILTSSNPRKRCHAFDKNILYPQTPTNTFLKKPTPSPIDSKILYSSSSDSQKSILSSTGVESWLNSYENIEDIQKRLQFLKKEFTSLSDKIMIQDKKLKQSPLQSYCNCYLDKPKFMEIRATSTKSKRLLCNDLEISLQKPSTPFASANLPCRTPPNLGQLRSQCCRPNSRLNRNFCAPTSPPPENPTLNKYRPSNIPTPTDPEQSKKCPKCSQRSKTHAKPHSSCIPVPKPRFSPLTLPTSTIPSLSSKPSEIKELINNRQSYKGCSQIPIQKEACTFSNSDTWESMFSNKSCFNFPLNKSIANDCFHQEPNKNCPSRSYLLYTNSNISTYKNTKKHLDQMKSWARTNNQHVNNNNHLDSDAMSPKNATFKSSSDSEQSDLSISAIINCSHLLNNVSKNCSDLLISKKEYVLKLFNQSGRSECDISELKGCVAKSPCMCLASTDRYLM